MPVLIVFFFATAGHLLLVGRWLRRFSPAHDWKPVELAFQTVAIGLGSLQALLHVLAFTIGLSLVRGLIGIAAVHAVARLFELVRARQAGERFDVASGAESPIGEGESETLGHVSFAGLVLVAAIVAQWIIFSARSLAVIGIDADHYHIPWAVNVALGVPASSVLATPHLYPMGTSVLAAWFILPLRDFLLVDLATLLPFLLAWVAIVRIFDEMTGRNGLAWGPPVALALFATPLFQAAVPMSSDLFYAAAFLALNAVLLKGSMRLRLDGVDLLSLACSTGMLVGSKSVGVFSAVTLVGAYGVIAVVHAALTRRKFSWPGLSTATGLIALLLAVASGGIWLIRNWWMFGSPIAPSGLSILGVQIFSGTSFESGRFYASVLRDIRDLEGYNVVARFAHWVRTWLGAWFLPAGLSLLWLLADGFVGLRRRHGWSPAARATLVFAGATFALTAAHLALFAAAPWSSLESYRGLSLRYVLPCFALYAICAYSCLFSTEIAWWRRRPAILASTLLVVTSVWYVAHQGIDQGQIDLPPARLTLPGIVIALLALALWRGKDRLSPGALRTAAGPALLALFAALAGAYVSGKDGVAIATATADFNREASSRDLANPYRDTYLAILEHERATGTSCPGRRLFITTRFDAPLDLQPPRFENELVESRVTFDLSRMRMEGAGSGPCDYVIASKREMDSVRGVQLVNLLRPIGSLTKAGEAGDFIVFAAKSPRRP